MSEVVGGPTSQSVLFTFDQINSHEYKITRKITLKPQHSDGTQLIRSRSDTKMIYIYIAILDVMSVNEYAIGVQYLVFL